MKCVICKTAKAMKHTDVCGICEIVASEELKIPFGAQTNDLVPAHFNMGLGKEIEGYDHLKKERLKARNEGIVSDWD